MGRVTKDFLIAHRLCLTQCSPNMFRILSSVDALNEKMGVNLTHHDVNQAYNSQLLKSIGYYLKTRFPEFRLISCLPKTNKGMDQDFMIISGEWHDGLHCPTQEEKPGGVFRLKFPVLTMHSVNSQSLIPFLVIRILAIIYLTNSYSNDTLFLGFLQISILQPPFLISSTEPNLMRILQSKIFVHTDKQLQAAHLIPGHKPISTSF